MSKSALLEWRSIRRRKRLADIHWIDALYQAYLTAMLSGIAILVGAGLIGDGQLSDSQVAHLSSRRRRLAGGDRRDRGRGRAAVGKPRRVRSRSSELMSAMCCSPRSTEPRPCAVPPSASCGSCCSSSTIVGAIGGPAGRTPAPRIGRGVDGVRRAVRARHRRTRLRRRAAGVERQAPLVDGLGPRADRGRRRDRRRARLGAPGGRRVREHRAVAARVRAPRAGADRARRRSRSARVCISSATSRSKLRNAGRRWSANCGSRPRCRTSGP